MMSKPRRADFVASLAQPLTPDRLDGYAKVIELVAPEDENCAALVQSGYEAAMVHFWHRLMDEYVDVVDHNSALHQIGFDDGAATWKDVEVELRRIADDLPTAEKRPKRRRRVKLSAAQLEAKCDIDDPTPKMNITQAMELFRWKDRGSFLQAINDGAIEAYKSSTARWHFSKRQVLFHNPAPQFES